MKPSPRSGVQSLRSPAVRKALRTDLPSAIWCPPHDRNVSTQFVRVDHRPSLRSHCHERQPV